MARLWQWLSQVFQVRRANLPDLPIVPVEAPVRIEGPLEVVCGRWLLRIPLDVGGRQLALHTRGIGKVSGNVLEVELPANLVKDLKLKEGQQLWVHNDGGRFTFEGDPTS